MNDSLIKIRGLRLQTRIGVPDEERADEQELRVNVDMVPPTAFSEMGDRIDATIDYHPVCLELAELARRGERRLIETLADEMADHVMTNHDAVEVRVEIEKFILPQTDWVGVQVVKRK